MTTTPKTMMSKGKKASKGFFDYSLKEKKEIVEKAGKEAQKMMQETISKSGKKCTCPYNRGTLTEFGKDTVCIACGKPIVSTPPPMVIEAAYQTRHDKKMAKLMQKLLHYQWMQVCGSVILKTPFGVLMWNSKKKDTQTGGKGV